MQEPTKSELRQAMLAARKRVILGDAQEAAQAIAERLPSLIAANALVAGYMPIRGELNIVPALHALYKGGARLALPKVLASGEMIFLSWAPDAPLEADTYGVLSPVCAEVVTPDVLLVPMLAFDRERFRLGYGGGYYDRAIATLNAKTIGIGYSLQYIEALPREAHDMRLDVVITEKGVV
jgi:5-formyltetrahydrofolate cyclo-ligase